jgi:hypothetical protein
LAAALAASIVRAQTAPQAPAFRLESTAFQDGASIPPQYACDGGNASPPLKWNDPPSKAKSLALIVTDIGAEAGWSHWVVYNIPSTMRELKSAYAWLSRRSDGMLQGRNMGDRAGYFGPCPDKRHTDRYAFKLYALDALMPNKPGYDRGELGNAMSGHILAEAQLIGTYSRNF